MGGGRGVLESAAGHLGWIDDACLDEVFILGGGDVVAVVAFAFLDFGNDESAFDACVGRKLTERSFDGTSDDFSAGLFVTGETEVADGGLSERVEKYKLKVEGITPDCWDREASGIKLKR